MKLKREKIFQFFYYISFGIYFAALFAENALRSDASDFVTDAKNVAMVFIIITLVYWLYKSKGKLKIRSGLIVFSILWITIIFSLIVNDPKLVFFLILIFLAEYVDAKKIPLLAIFISIIMIAITLYQYTKGMIPEIIPLAGDRTTMSLSLSLGFYHYSKLPLAVMYMYFYYLLLMGTASWTSIIVITALQCILYYLCGSRNAFLCVMILNFLLISMKLNWKRQKFRRGLLKVAKFAMLATVIISFVLLILYMANSSFGYAANKFFNNRLVTAANYIRERGIHIIGYTDYESLFDTKYRSGADNSYYYITFRYGLVMLILLLALYNNLYKKAIAHVENYVLFAVMITFSIAIAIDNVVLNYGALTIYIYFYSMSRKRIWKDNSVSERILVGNQVK